MKSRVWGLLGVGLSENSATVEHEDGATQGGRLMSGEVGGCSGSARNATNCAESGQADDVLADHAGRDARQLELFPLAPAREPRTAD